MKYISTNKNKINELKEITEYLNIKIELLNKDLNIIEKETNNLIDIIIDKVNQTEEGIIIDDSTITYKNENIYNFKYRYKEFNNKFITWNVGVAIKLDNKVFYQLASLKGKLILNEKDNFDMLEIFYIKGISLKELLNKEKNNLKILPRTKAIKGLFKKIKNYI